MKRDRCTTGRLLRMGFAISCFALPPAPLICDDGAKPKPDASVSPHHTIRDLDMKVEVKPGSKTVKLTITNHSAPSRFLWGPPDLNVYRISLMDANGLPLKTTRKGHAELTEPSAGTIRVNELKNGESRSTSIDLGPLFEFPQDATIRCEISRLVHFTDPRTKPAESEWIQFPPVNIVLGNAMPPPAPRRPPVNIVAPGNSTGRGTDWNGTQLSPAGSAARWRFL